MKRLTVVALTVLLLAGGVSVGQAGPPYIGYMASAYVETSVPPYTSDGPYEHAPPVTAQVFQFTDPFYAYASSDGPFPDGLPHPASIELQAKAKSTGDQVSLIGRSSSSSRYRISVFTATAPLLKVSFDYDYSLSLTYVLGGSSAISIFLSLYDQTDNQWVLYPGYPGPGTVNINLDYTTGSGSLIHSNRPFALPIPVIVGHVYEFKLVLDAATQAADPFEVAAASGTIRNIYPRVVTPLPGVISLLLHP